jgi:uncharacterized protein (TIGR04255 family)
MPFADAKRVIYNKNPLIQVVCELRFPRILSINETPPVEFQERIRKSYPIYNVTTNWQQELSIEPINIHDAPPLPRVTQAENIKNYWFFSADNNWYVHLTVSSLALSTSKYIRWENFLEKLNELLEALVEIYKPAFYERIGLRYVDAFSRSTLNIDQKTPWGELINPFVLGFLSNNDIYDDIKGYSATYEIDLGNNAMARIITSIGFVGSAMYQQNSELSFIVDSDLFFHSKKDLDEIDISLNSLHKHANRIIRSIITERLHQAMEPQEA